MVISLILSVIKAISVKEDGTITLSINKGGLSLSLDREGNLSLEAGSSIILKSKLIFLIADSDPSSYDHFISDTQATTKLIDSPQPPLGVQHGIEANCTSR